MAPLSLYFDPCGPYALDVPHLTHFSALFSIISRWVPRVTDSLWTTQTSRRRYKASPSHPARPPPTARPHPPPVKLLKPAGTSKSTVGRGHVISPLASSSPRCYLCPALATRERRQSQHAPRRQSQHAPRPRRSRRPCLARRAVGSAVLSTHRTGNSRFCRRPGERGESVGNNDHAVFTTKNKTPAVPRAEKIPAQDASDDQSREGPNATLPVVDAVRPSEVVYSEPVLHRTQAPIRPRPPTPSRPRRLAHDLANDVTHAHKLAATSSTPSSPRLRPPPHPRTSPDLATSPASPISPSIRSKRRAFAAKFQGRK
ncbi:hypothetical protein BD626DRAFT_231393 [Schizophyllum amplum]|uniref:Uncharacterized protein n=1 Tax=Schizophyllum amplum TaxID=97359 RepID=A0A550BW89_9AGAR|nr:hypothetical protein BD626DRAFT_231393 [Auriculariopsis ampla]